METIVLCFFPAVKQPGRLQDVRITLMNEPPGAGARPSHMVLELRLGVERLGGRRGDDWRRRRGRGASGKTGDNDARGATKAQRS